MGITPLALLDEFTLLDERIEELLDERIEELLEGIMLLLDEERMLEETVLEEITLLLDDERILEEIIELDELSLIELDEELRGPQPLTKPHGAGWLPQVAMEIQLLLFS